MSKVFRSSLWWLLLSVLIILLDQVSKHLALAYLQDAPLPLLPVLNFQLAFNYGAAFSFMSDPSGWQGYFFSALAFVVSVVLVWWLRNTDPRDRWQALALSLIVGGALGNVMDRCWHGFVVDFIDFHIGAWHFATFNVADSAITIGAIILIIKLLFEAKNK